MGVLQAIKSGKRKLAVVGLGYVGLPLALAFAAEAAHHWFR
jgi:UDP-N-acetyl-D-mannosaminuronate dehydrogenase